MAAITDYATLTTAISDWAERTYTAGQTDQFIALAEAEFRLHFSPNFAKETKATLTVTTGSASLPSGFIRPISMVHASYGEVKQTDIGTVRERRITDSTGSVPRAYAVTGTTIEVDAAAYTGSLTLDYEGTLTGLSSGNTTNWLITNAPQAYLAMCMSVAKARDEDFQTAAAYRASAMSILDDLGMQSNLGQLARAAVTINGATP